MKFHIYTWDVVNIAKKAEHPNRKYVDRCIHIGDLVPIDPETDLQDR